MGKVRTRTKKTSKGQRPSISRSTVRAVKETKTEVDKLLNKVEAWKRGKKGFVTIANPNPSETDKKFIKVSFERYFGGSYKDIKSRVKRSDDNNKVEF